MAGLNLGTGFSGSVFAGGWPGYTSASSVPTATTVPEGPSSITQAAYGVPGAGSGGSKGLSAAAIGTAAIVGLLFLWWSLPR